MVAGMRLSLFAIRAAVAYRAAGYIQCRIAQARCPCGIPSPSKIGSGPSAGSNGSSAALQLPRRTKTYGT